MLGPTSRFDLGNVAIVDLAYGTLASVTDLALYAGANALAVEPSPGVWEVLQAGRRRAIAPGRYRLSRLLRGQRGTEGAIGAPAPAGARIVVLDEALTPLPIQQAALGLEANWRFGPASRPVADRSYRRCPPSPEGRRFATILGRPCRQKPWRTARESGDLASAGPAARGRSPPTAGPPPRRRSAEEREVYEVEILDGAAVVRTLTTPTTSVTYTAAQQLADLGALLGSGDTLPIRLFQLSVLVGRGAPASSSLEF